MNLSELYRAIEDMLHQLDQTAASIRDFIENTL